ncbi:MAG: MGH1-like glycoside hydrolase domain-containing protein, partial [Polyangiales bacterium]
MSLASLRSACERVLHDSWCGTHTGLSPAHKDARQALNSALAAVGWAHLNQARAWQELQHWLLPGEGGQLGVQTAVVPARSRLIDSAALTPPFWASAARRVVEVAGLEEELEPLLPALEALHSALASEHDPLSWGLMAVRTPAQAGSVGSPLWEVVSRDDTGLCHVYDPFSNALWARAESDLAWLAEQVGWRSQAERRFAAIVHGLEQRLWDAELGHFVHFDVQAERVLPLDGIGAYAPAWC